MNRRPFADPRNRTGTPLYVDLDAGTPLEVDEITAMQAEIGYWESYLSQKRVWIEQVRKRLKKGT